MNWKFALIEIEFILIKHEWMNLDIDCVDRKVPGSFSSTIAVLVVAMSSIIAIVFAIPALIIVAIAMLFIAGSIMVRTITKIFALRFVIRLNQVNHKK